MGAAERRVYRIRKMTFPKFINKHLQEALFSPADFIEYKKLPRNLSKKYILIYSNSVLRHIKRKYSPKRIKLMSNTNFYQYKDLVFVKMKGIGSPHATTVLEELIALGGRNFLNIGMAGGLHHEGIFLCNKALRDEGTSYHYLPHGHYSYPDKKLTEKLGKAIEKQSLEYSKGTTWTIDAPYRETKAEIEKYAKQGISIVEMETSALFAVAKYRKVKIASAFVVSDLLGEKWQPKFHDIKVRKTLNKLVDAAVECLRKI